MITAFTVLIHLSCQQYRWSICHGITWSTSTEYTDGEALALEESGYADLPAVRQVASEDVLANFLQVKKDVLELIDSEIERIMDTPELEHLLIKKG